MDCKELAEDHDRLKKDLRLILITILTTNALWVIWTIFHHIVH